MFLFDTAHPVEVFYRGKLVLSVLENFSDSSVGMFIDGDRTYRSSTTRSCVPTVAMLSEVDL